MERAIRCASRLISRSALQADGGGQAGGARSDDDRVRIGFHPRQRISSSS